MCNKHMRSNVTRSSRFHCLIGVINKPTMVRGHSRSWAIPPFDRAHIYDFLFDFNRNHASILYRFRDIGLASYLSKVADFDPLHLHFAPSQGGGDPGRISRRSLAPENKSPRAIVCC